MTEFAEIQKECENCFDLHTHSTASDGTDSPTELMRKAAEIGLSTIAVTDHDTVSGIDEASKEILTLQASGINLKLIPGCEFSVSYCNRDIHVLGLFLDNKNIQLLDLLEQATHSRENRNREMIKRFQKKGYDISYEDLLSLSSDTEITRAHFARVLVEKHYAKDFPDAFARFVGDNCPFYVNRTYSEPETVLETIHNAGGIAVLAHPLQYRYSPEKLRNMIEFFSSYGLDAMETKYSAYGNEEEMYLRSLALRYSLKRSGGSDYHGTVKPGLSLGTGYGNDWKIQPEDVTVL